ncbi:YdeI/OmpD-associated family protein [Umezawaea sp. NPDC059074]|uniref:YdeI/OmpD-associated family protein n=1 Tax=Umezawaea sp. NPDC059074 TaxID=3346716 RepID=UPI00369A4C08
MRFRATVLQSGKTATGVRVPDEVVDGLGSGRRPAVLARIGDYEYRTSVGSMGGVFMLPISAEVRAGAGVAAGDDIEVELALDTAVREVVVPEDLAAALDDAARARFDALSYSAKRRLVMPIDDAKTPETRQRRVAKVVEGLQG